MNDACLSLQEQQGLWPEEEAEVRLDEKEKAEVQHDAEKEVMSDQTPRMSAGKLAALITACAGFVGALTAFVNLADHWVADVIVIGFFVMVAVVFVFLMVIAYKRRKTISRWIFGPKKDRNQPDLFE